MRVLVLAAAAAAAPWSEPRWRVGTVRGPSVAAAAGNDLLGAWLREALAGSRRPFLAARLSLGAELAVAAAWVRGSRNASAPPALRTNAGVYPATAAEAARFAAAYVGAFNGSALVARFGGAAAAAEDAVVAALAPRAVLVHNRALEPFYFARAPWSAALACVKNKIFMIRSTLSMVNG